MIKKARLAPLFILVMLILTAFAAFSLLLPDAEYSRLENRALAQAPPFSWSQVASGRYMDQAEGYVNDQLPLRDAFVKLNLLKEMTLLRTEAGGVVRGRGQRLFNQSKQVDGGDVETKINALARFANSTKLPFTLVMVPPSSVMYQDELPFFYPLADPVAVIEAAVSKHAGLNQVPLKEALTLEKQQHMTHYRTDHHLTAHGAMAVYRAMGRHLGFTAQQDDAGVQALDGFLGSLYARAPFPFMQAEELSYFDPAQISLEIDGAAMPGLLDQALLERPNMYAALLYNNPGHLVLRNPAGERGAALVLRDSNANVILPLLARHYKALHVIDFRHLKPGFPLFELIEGQDIKEVLCIYGTDVFLSDRNLLLHLGASRD